ncbi:MAG: PLP-dependent transferase, partial [Pseudomonadota bacterium]
AAIRPETRLVYTESIGNPGLEVSNIPALAEVAHDAGLPLMVDATFVTPYLQRPISLGADLVVHSLTKWMGGHGVAMGGALVDGGTFDWGASGKFPTLTEPYAGYHGLNFWEEFGPQAFCMRARAEGLRDVGPALNPHAAFTLMQGIETLSVRMERHQSNTAKVLEFLSKAMADEKGVAWVWHPTMPDHPDHKLAQELLPKGAGSVISFGIQAGADGDARAAGRRFIEALKLVSHLANVGDAKTLVIHPASTTHSQMGPEQLQKAGIGEEMIRLSVGLEDADDIITDLKTGLRAALKG